MQLDYYILNIVIEGKCGITDERMHDFPYIYIESKNSLVLIVWENIF